MSCSLSCHGAATSLRKGRFVYFYRLCKLSLPSPVLCNILPLHITVSPTHTWLHNTPAWPHHNPTATKRHQTASTNNELRGILALLVMFWVNTTSNACAKRLVVAGGGDIMVKIGTAANSSQHLWRWHVHRYHDQFRQGVHFHSTLHDPFTEVNVVRGQV